MMRRSLTVVGLTVLALVLGAGVAAASDLTEILERSDAADYSGRRLVLTTWDGVTVAEIFDVEHTAGVTVIVDDQGGAMVGEGKTIGRAADFAVAQWSPGILGLRYELDGPEPVRYLGRDAESVDVFEGELRRASLVFDVATGAPLSTEFFDAQGDRYRVSHMLSFAPATTGRVPLIVSNAGTYDVMISVEGTSLPMTVAGYWQADAYRGPDDVGHAFYTDGLFSFSVFRIPGLIEVPEAGGLQFEANGMEYRRTLSPGDVWVSWSVADTSYVLVGDLPPDHLDAALAELPRLRRRGFFGRLWHGLFG